MLRWLNVMNLEILISWQVLLYWKIDAWQVPLKTKLAGSPQLWQVPFNSGRFFSTRAGSTMAGSSLILVGSPEPANFISFGTCHSKSITFGCLSGTKHFLYFLI